MKKFFSGLAAGFSQYAMGAEAASQQRRQQLSAAFKAIDTDGSGSLDFAEIKAAFEKAGDKLSDDELKKLFDLVDKDHSGSIDFEEFCRLDGRKFQSIGKQVMSLVDATITQPIAAVGETVGNLGSSMKTLIVGASAT
jgi:hypothetical protein